MSATKHNIPGGGANNDRGVSAPYTVPPEPNRWPAIGLAVGMHAMLLAFLWIGVSWQNNTPVAVEAEVWDVTTQTAAPPPPPPAPEPEPEPQPEPPPAPAPRVAEPPPVAEPAPPKQPDIALEREKKRKEELKKHQAEEQERQERERELAEKKEKALAEKKERELAEKKERELEQQRAEKKEKARLEAEKKEAEKKDAEKKKKEEAEKKKKEEAAKKKQAAEEERKLAALRGDEMRRITGAAGNGSSGTAEKSTAPRIDKGYTAAITAKIKGNTSYGGSLDEPGNPTAVFRVEQLPTGEIVSVRKIKSSGIPAFDDAVEKGINKSSPLPKKKDGTVERSLEINFHMKDLQ
jgi:colicin import membrane protein